MTTEQDKHIEDVMAAANVLAMLTDSLKDYPGNEYAHRVRSAFTVASFIVTDYGLRCVRGQEPFDALGDALASMKAEAGVADVSLVFREPDKT